MVMVTIIPQCIAKRKRRTRKTKKRSHMNVCVLTSSPLYETGKLSGKMWEVKEQHWSIIDYLFKLHRVCVCVFIMKDIVRRASGTCRLQQSRDWPLRMYTCSTKTHSSVAILLATWFIDIINNQYINNLIGLIDHWLSYLRWAATISS